VIYRVIKIALEAGKEIMEVYRKSFSVEYKEDRTPLTEADRRSHRTITGGLRKLDPSIPVLSEEGKEIPHEERKNWQRFWLVDPLDGTKEFVKRTGEFTVNIALLEEKLKAQVERIEFVSVGSSLKMCLVAEGTADIYPRLGPTMEWDTAAGHIIALEAGCDIRIYNGKLSDILTYNKEDLVNPGFVVFRREKACLL